jgi:hypothetical protein
MLGATLFDGHLGDYGWDAGPVFEGGISATLYRGAFAAGLRVVRAGTVQASGIPGEDAAPRVALTSFEMAPSARLVRWLGVELWATARGGLLHLGYDPDELTFGLGGAGEPITVNYDPLSEWLLGWGVALRREIAQRAALSIEAEQSSFALDTSHRRGDEIVESRERFYNWHLRMQVSWLIDLW